MDKRTGQKLLRFDRQSRRAARRGRGRSRAWLARRPARRRRRPARLRLPARASRAAARVSQRLEAVLARAAGGAVPRRRRVCRARRRARHPGGRHRPERPPQVEPRRAPGDARGAASRPRRASSTASASAPTAPEHTAVIDGDEKSAAIAAASIVAKVTRDRLMRRLDALYPAYGFAQHVGYITPGHSAAVRRAGPSAVHRLSFEARCYEEAKQLPRSGAGESAERKARVVVPAARLADPRRRTSGRRGTSST